MRLARSKNVCLSVLLGVALGSVAVASSPSILRVERQVLGGPDGDPALDGRGRMMTMFIDDMQVTGEHTYDVLWEAPGGLTHPVTILMEYRHAAGGPVRRLMVEYPPETRGQQVARFRIPAAHIERRGEVTAWRIQLKQGERTLDQKTFGRWRGGKEDGGRR